MKLKQFQKTDLARAALHDGLILSWDTGLGKTWAIYLWLLLKVGYTADQIVSVGLLDNPKLGFRPPTEGRPFSPNARRIKPKQPVLIIAPGDLHQQIINEAWTVFGIAVFHMDSQATFEAVHRASGGRRDSSNRPILTPEFYITSYTELTTNGVHRVSEIAKGFTNASDLLKELCLTIGEHVPQSDTDRVAKLKKLRVPTWDDRPDLTTVCHFYAWRSVRYASQYLMFGLDARTATISTLQRAYRQKLENVELAGGNNVDFIKSIVTDAFNNLSHYTNQKADPHFADLTPTQQAAISADFCHMKLADYEHGNNSAVTYHQGEDGKWFDPLKVPPPERDKLTGEVPKVKPPAATLKIRCVYSPSLADLSEDAYRGVAIDEGVKMKGAHTYVGHGVRQMNPEYRLVLTATPIKNRVPDLFWLAHWATGGKDHAHARWPYRNDISEQEKFAETFMVSEDNLTKTENSETGRRYAKLTAEVCNVHKLWKLLGPLLLRRRKDQCGEDIVKKERHFIRCAMGSHQANVVNYHLQAQYLDKNGDDAIGARLQALRACAADPCSTNLRSQGLPEEQPTRRCECTYLPVPPSVQRQRLLTEQAEVTLKLPNLKNGEALTAKSRLEDIAAELITPVKRYDVKPAVTNCRHCHGEGKLTLNPSSRYAYIPKHASVLTLIQEILARGEQVVVGAAFIDPLDKLSNWLTEAGVRHMKLDGETSPTQRGKRAAVFKRGRVHIGDTDLATPVMLAGVECMAEGHSFDKANNIILLAYSWAYDKFVQFINRVHRMTSKRTVNVYVVVCAGSIDGKLESLIGEKGDSSELVLDGRLLGESSEEVNLADLLKIAHREFNTLDGTIDEAELAKSWPALRENLRTAMRTWDQDIPTIAPPAKPSKKKSTAGRAVLPRRPNIQRPASAGTLSYRYDPATGRYAAEIIEAAPSLPPPPPSARPAVKAPASWQAALTPRKSLVVPVRSRNPWDDL